MPIRPRRAGEMSPLRSPAEMLAHREKHSCRSSPRTTHEECARELRSQCPLSLRVGRTAAKVRSKGAAPVACYPLAPDSRKHGNVRFVEDSALVETAGFEEKQYESALSQELAAGEPTGISQWPSPRGTGGGDVAMRPGEPKIWKLLDAGFPPGVVLSSGLWATAPKRPDQSDLPRDLVSLMLQTKRPHLLDHWRAGQYHYWRGPYFGSTSTSTSKRSSARSKKTISVLRLSFGMPQPRFLASTPSMPVGNRTIADHSTFVSPSVLYGHRLWSYTQAGTSGYVNPEGEPAQADTWRTLFERARALATRGLLKNIFADWQLMTLPSPHGSNRFFLIPRISRRKRRRRAVGAWSAIAQRIARTGAEWFVLDVTSSIHPDAGGVRDRSTTAPLRIAASSAS